MKDSNRNKARLAAQAAKRAPAVSKFAAKRAAQFARTAQVKEGVQA